MRAQVVSFANQPDSRKRDSAAGDTKPVAFLRMVASRPERDECEPVPDPETRPFRAGDLEENATLDDPNRGPARGIVVGLLPALLVWAALISLVIKLL